MPRRPVAAVIGAASSSRRVTDAAERLGTLLVDAGFRVVTGGGGGVMAAASRGARASVRHVDGDVLAVLPGASPAGANEWADVVIPTGLGHARNVVVVLAADVVIACGGGAGTLSEIALAWAHGRPVIAVDLGEGWSAELAGRALDARRQDVILRACSAEEAVAAAHAALPR